MLEKITLMTVGNGDGTATLDNINISRAGECYEQAKEVRRPFIWEIGNWRLIFNSDDGVEA